MLMGFKSLMINRTKLIHEWEDRHICPITKASSSHRYREEKHLMPPRFFYKEAAQMKLP